MDKQTTKRVTLIKAVKTPLGFFVFVVLILDSVFGVLVAVNPVEHKLFLLIAMVGMALFTIIVVALIACFRPEALDGERNILLLPFLAECLGKDVFAAFDDAMRSNPAKRMRAYAKLINLITGAQYYQARETRGFVQAYLNAITATAGIPCEAH
jgi:hypothetical protein